MNVNRQGGPVEGKLSRREAVRRLLTPRENFLIISSLGGPSNDVAATTGQHELDYYLGGAMGATAMMALGLARAQPQRRVLAFAGDGEMLMAMGALATIGADKPQNLAVIVIDNESYGETGMQLAHTGRGVDLAAVAASCGFSETYVARKLSDLEEAARLIRNPKGPIFVTLKVEKDSPPVVPRVRDGAWIKSRFRQALLGHV